MPPDLLFPLIVSVLAAIGLQNFRDYFQQAGKEEQDVKFKAEDLLGTLARDVVIELENDVQRAFDPDLNNILGDGFRLKRRQDVAEALTKKITKQTKQQMRLEILYQNWCNWENRGYNVCAYGWMMYAFIVLGSFILVIWPTLFNNIFYTILIFLIIFPILTVVICYIITSRHKQRFLDCKRDRETT